MLLFKGERVVREEHLSEADPHSQYKAAGDIYAQSRDVSKYWAPGKVTISLIGLENHTDRIWEHPLSLRDCFDVDPRMDPYISDYRVNIVNVAFLSPDVISRFQSDFRYIADFLYQRRTTGKYHNRIGQPMKHMEELIDALKAFTGDKHSETAYNVNKSNDDRREMRSPMSSQDVQMFIDGLAKYAEEQAIERGEKIGFARGFARGQAKREALSEERGKALGETAVQTLGSRMRRDGRTEEFLNAMDDHDLLSALLKEYGL